MELTFNLQLPQQITFPSFQITNYVPITVRKRVWGPALSRTGASLLRRESGLIRLEIEASWGWAGSLFLDRSIPLLTRGIHRWQTTVQIGLDLSVDVKISNLFLLTLVSTPNLSLRPQGRTIMIGIIYYCILHGQCAQCKMLDLWACGICGSFSIYTFDSISWKVSSLYSLGNTHWARSQGKVFLVAMSRNEIRKRKQRFKCSTRKNSFPNKTQDYAFNRILTCVNISKNMFSEQIFPLFSWCLPQTDNQMCNCHGDCTVAPSVVKCCQKLSSVMKIFQIFLNVQIFNQTYFLNI